AQRRVRLFRRGGVHAGADAALLRAALQRWNLVARPLRPSRVGDQLIDRRHRDHILTSAAAAETKPRNETLPASSRGPQHETPLRGGWFPGAMGAASGR